MKLAIFSDIHGNLEALSAILDDIKKQDFDEIICLGDVIGIGPNPKECLERIQDHSIRLLLGNHERYAIFGASDLPQEEQKHQEWVRNELDAADITYLKSCPLFYKISNVLFEHFIIEDETQINPFVGLNDDKIISAKIKEVEAKLIFVGHQHRPFLADKMVCIGSSGCTKNNKTFYYSVIIEDTIHYDKHVIYYDRATFETKLQQKDYPERDFIARGFFGILK